MSKSFSISTNTQTHHPQLQSIRSKKPQRSTLLSGILDVKLREIGRLETRQQVLDSCQTWMRDKVLYYMNLLDEAEVKYYIQAEELMSRLLAKEAALLRQTKITEEYQSHISALQATLTTLKDENQSLQMALQREFQFKDEDMKKYVSINKLQNTNSQLNRRIEALTKENQENQGELERLRALEEANRGQIELLQNQMFRLRARLQDKESQQDENIKYIAEYRIYYAISISIKPENKQPKRLVGERLLRQCMIEGLIVRNKAPRTDQELENIFLSQGFRQRDEGTQTVNPYLWTTKLKDIKIDGRSKQSKNLGKMMKKEEAAMEEQAQRMRESYRREVMSLKKDIQKLMLESQEITDKRFKSLMEERDELIEILDHRPSREEDIEYIHTLKEENKELMSLSSQAHNKASTAYTAMVELKTELDRYKQNTTLMVRPKIRRHSNLECDTPNPLCTTFFSHRGTMSVSKKRIRNKSKQEDIFISSIIRDSLGTVDLSIKNGRKLNTSLSVYRDQFNRTVHRSIL